MTHGLPRNVGVLALAGILAACSGSGDSGRVTMQLATRSASMTSMTRAGTVRPQLSAGAIPGQATIAAGGDTIVIDQVEMVLRKIRLRATSASECGNSDVSGVDGEDCGELELGPAVFDLPLGEGVTRAFTALVPAGNYDRLQFQLHRPTNANEDADLVAGHPELANTSIRVTGSFKPAGSGAAAPFTYMTDLTADQEVEFTQALGVDGGAEVSMTVDVDLSGWFANGAGGLIDPATALNGAVNESPVEQNIRASFRAFRDQNADGTED
ncbi:MAG: hypothetical protein H0W67_01180 [Gemmatimonadales bacterium]|nr:hypothetical protein [Gemmatimonadales bacterium]